MAQLVINSDFQIINKIIKPFKYQGDMFKSIKLFFCFSSILFLTISCTDLKDEIKEAADGNKIDQSEYKKITKFISDKEIETFNENGKLIDKKLVAYIINICSKENLPISEKDIWQDKSSAPKTQSFNLNVFVENSASMDGYVAGVTEFESAIYNLLGDFKINGITNQLNLNYINSSIRSHKNDALSADIQDFIFRLEPTTFKQRRGQAGNSDMQKIINSVLTTVDEKNVSVLISDFVFSDPSGAESQQYLTNQGVGIKINFAEKLQNFNLSAIVIQLESSFSGTYYDKKITPITLPTNTKRPYYIWILGSTSQIQTILDSKILDNIKGGYLNRLVMSKIKQESSPNFKILINPKIGEFSSEGLDKKIIFDAEPSEKPNTKGLFGFDLAVDFSSSMQDKKYFLDKNNYRLSNTSYNLTTKTINDPNNISLKGFTHIIHLETKKIQDGPLKIDVIGNTPNWVYNSTSMDDSNIQTDAEEQKKTFGFKFLMEGINDAFYPKTNTNTINSLTVTIKK